MARLSEKEKLKRGYGTEEDKDYKPYIRAREFNSLGTTAMIPDYKNGRSVELLSQNEMYFWYLLRFKPDVESIKEQYPLDLESTVQLAKENGIRHPKNKQTHMTTDFFVTYTDHHTEAFSLKNDMNFNRRTKEKLFLEQAYWEKEHIPFHIILGIAIDKVKAENIRMCSYYYHPESVMDEIGCLKHMIITGKLEVDLSTAFLIPRQVFEQNKERVLKEWAMLQSQRLQFQKDC